jgi:hypothetical protein
MNRIFLQWQLQELELKMNHDIITFNTSIVIYLLAKYDEYDIHSHQLLFIYYYYSV